jgi:hypothetical protein
LNENEKKIIKARGSGLSFCQLSNSEQRVAIDDITFKGASICGCGLPQTELFAKHLAEEIQVHLLEFGYAEYTLEEIILALRINSKGRIRNPAGEDLEQVIFFGSFINVTYLSKILQNYSVLRNNLDRKFENHIDGY